MLALPRRRICRQTSMSATRASAAPRRLPHTAFVNFLQNHDQIGNARLGERQDHIVHEDALRAAAAVLLLAPSPPMLFMGEEWAATAPFPYFCDFGSELAGQVRAGRLKEFAHFSQFRDERARAAIPDPGAYATFAAAKLRWDEIEEPWHQLWLERYRRLLELRHRWIAPALPHIGAAQITDTGASSLIEIDWPLRKGARLRLSANLSDQEQERRRHYRRSCIRRRPPRRAPPGAWSGA